MSTATVLVVTHPFAGYARGDVISDAATIASVSASAQAHRTVRVAAPAQPAAAAPASATETALSAAETAIKAAEAAVAKAAQPAP